MKNKLEHIDHRHPFKVPEKYFDQLYDDILDRKSHIKGTKSESVPVRLVWALSSIAAVIVLLFVFIFPKQQDTSTDWLADIATEEIMAYLYSNGDITTDELADYLYTDDLLPEEMIQSLPEDIFENEDMINDLINDFYFDSKLPEI